MRAILVVGVGATLALLFYAKYGIDLLEYAYIGLFYYAVPALLVAVAATGAYAAANLRRKTTVALVLSALCCILTWSQIRKPVDYLPQYNQPESKTLYDSLRQVPHQGRLVLDLDFSQDQGFLWSNILGLEVYAKRRHDLFFCLNVNWHISNTRAAQCTPDEVARSPRYVVRKLLPSGEKTVAEGMGMGVYDFQVPDLAAIGAVTVGRAPNCSQDRSWAAAGR